MSESLFEFTEFRNVNLRENLIVFLGSPLVDLIVEVDGLLMDKYNLQIDQTYPIGAVTGEIFNDLLELDPIVQIGGSVTNTARIFGKITNSPKSIIYFGTIGGDDYGALIQKQFKLEKIPNNLRKIDNGSTGKVGVLLYRNGRTLVTDLGISQKFSDDFFERNRVVFEKSQYFYVSLLFIKISFEIIRKIVDFFREKRKIVAINLGASFLPVQHPVETNFLFQSADLIFGNEKELRAFAEINQIPFNNPFKILQEINCKFPKENRTVLITRGEKSILLSNSGKIREFPVKIIENIVDTNGAGDAFVGGFLAGFCQNQKLENCVEMGIWAAGKVIQNYGCNL